MEALLQGGPADGRTVEIHEAVLEINIPEIVGAHVLTVEEVDDAFARFLSGEQDQIFPARPPKNHRYRRGPSPFDGVARFYYVVNPGDDAGDE